MTKYVLNSGGIKNHAVRKKNFHLELVKGVGNNPKFLMCNFAQAREYWEEKFPIYCESIKEDLSNDMRPTFELAFPDIFEDQTVNADIIYFHGGDDHLLQYWLKQFDLAKIMEGKVVATNSASTDAIAASYWTCDWRKCMNGLGILPIKVVPHYNSKWGEDDPRGPIDWDKAKAELAEYGDKALPIYALEEGEFVVFEV